MHLGIIRPRPRGTFGCEGESSLPITTTEELMDHIELAIRVELSTIPPYLFAMYSIADQGSEPALLLRSIVVEEMLHAALAANLLVAVGGKPDFASDAYLPHYPLELPHHKPRLMVDLAPCSLETIRDVFMRIEQPEEHGAPPQPDEFETLGQFYYALELGLREVSASHDLFADATSSRQLGDPSFYAPVAFDAEDSGALVFIDDLETAIEAIEIIIHQGEGLSEDKWADESHQELTHYHKLLRIHQGESPLGEVRPLRANPRTNDYPPELRPVSDLFNAAYRCILILMGECYVRDVDQRMKVDRMYRLMTGVLSPTARYLVRQPLGDGFAGPTFEVVDLAPEDPLGELLRLSAETVSGHPELAGVRELISQL